MPEVQGTPPTHPGVKGFLTNNTAGMPNWVWLLVIAGGIGLAFVVKNWYGKSAGKTPTTGTTPDSGLGLAIDPTTGLPYAVEGLVPSGGNAGTGTQGPPGPAGPPGPPGKDDKGGDTHPIIGGGNPRANQFDFSWIGTLKPGTTYSLGGYDPVTGLQRFWYTEPGGTTQLRWLPGGSTIVKGGSGRIWINPAGLPKGQQGIQLTGTSPDWPGNTIQTRVS